MSLRPILFRDENGNLPNIHPETGVHYGVAQTSTGTPGWFWDEAEPHYAPATCPRCGTEIPDADIDRHTCESCGLEVTSDEFYPDEPDAWVIDSDDLKAFTTGDGTHIFITFSTRVVECRECSPCFPYAGDLGSIGEGITPTYAFPKED